MRKFQSRDENLAAPQPTAGQINDDEKSQVPEDAMVSGSLREGGVPRSVPKDGSSSQVPEDGTGKAGVSMVTEERRRRKEMGVSHR